MTWRAPFVLAVSLAVSVVGCSGGGSAGDGGLDAGLDAYEPPDAFVFDSGECDMPCEAGVCCMGSDGAPHCVDLSSDTANCGVCGRDCVASRRGDHCEAYQCACGDFAIGCTGSEVSVCCAHSATLSPYCANFGLDVTDCGGCGMECNRAQANACSAGRCTCGDSGTTCAGTAADLCCGDSTGTFTCVDTTNRQDHCGACGNRCSAFTRCVDGMCVPTIPDAGLPSDAGTDAG
jgi:hypothetical protein